MTSGGESGLPCCGLTTITDSRDGQVYPVIQIGGQCWLQKNMNYQVGMSWCYGNDTFNCDTFGRLYDWHTARGACPSGWHLPSDAEWTALMNELGGETVAGAKMKSADGWNNNENSTNSSGFTALPGGNCYRNYLFNGLMGRAYFWTSTATSAANAWNRHLYDDQQGIFRDNYDKSHGFSVRCVKD
ncbi:MAG: fibrobacter succinogenes major paralogous domain-containing protein [Bacteroidales bacterium]